MTLAYSSGVPSSLLWTVHTCGVTWQTLILQPVRASHSFEELEESRPPPTKVISTQIAIVHRQNSEGNVCAPDPNNF